MSAGRNMTLSERYARDRCRDRLIIGLLVVVSAEVVHLMLLLARPLYSSLDAADRIPASRLVGWSLIFALVTVSLLAGLVRQRGVLYAILAAYVAWWTIDTVVLSTTEYALPSDMPWFSPAAFYGMPIAILAVAISWGAHFLSRGLRFLQRES